MNKLLIILLAICLVTVHAYVKRDAPASQGTDGVDIGKKFAEFGDNIKQTFEKAVDPEEVKKQFNTFVDTMNNLFQKEKKPAA